MQTFYHSAIGALKILVPACTTHEGVSLCADFEEAVLSPTLWRMIGSTIASGEPFALEFK